jgi:hypothetical protein
MREPEILDVPVEKPRAFRKMAELLCGVPVDHRRLAGMLSLSPSMMRDILDVYAERKDPPKATGAVPPAGGRILGFRN